MGSMNKSTPTKKSQATAKKGTSGNLELLQVRVAPEVKRALERRAEKTGSKLSAVARSAIETGIAHEGGYGLRMTPSAPVQRIPEAVLLRKELNRLGVNLNQLVRAVNAGKAPSVAHELTSTLEALRGQMAQVVASLERLEAGTAPAPAPVAAPVVEKSSTVEPRKAPEKSTVARPTVKKSSTVAPQKTPQKSAVARPTVRRTAVPAVPASTSRRTVATPNTATGSAPAVSGETVARGPVAGLRRRPLVRRTAGGGAQ